MSIKRIQELYTYNPSKGLINEGFGDVDTSNYVCVGEVPYWPWGNNGDKVYAMVSPQKIKKWGNEVFDIRYTENNDGSGMQTDSIPSYAIERMRIYPEHYDDEYGEVFLGKKKSKEELELKHERFVSNLFRIDGNVILHHNSSYEITDGYIKKGEKNSWSNNADIGIYFWASRNSGSDPSGNSKYTYYCIINENSLYDFETNEERLTLPQALSKHDYVGQFWRENSDAIVVNTFLKTPIWSILDKQTGQWFDKDWNEIEKPF